MLRRVCLCWIQRRESMTQTRRLVMGKTPWRLSLRSVYGREWQYKSSGIRLSFDCGCRHSHKDGRRRLAASFEVHGHACLRRTAHVVA
jgi:hypothetical protein